MREILLIKCGEMVLKGNNKRSFEEKLITNLRAVCNKFGKCKIYSLQSTIYIEPEDDICVDNLILKIQKVFGIVVICKTAVCRKDIHDICSIAEMYLKEKLLSVRTFKVESKRADKKFPLNSIQISQYVGGVLHSKFSNLIPDMHDPDVVVNVEIRDHDAFVYVYRALGAGGMPVGINGKASLLLSGGIDSPVAGYMMAKRGMAIEAIHFFSYPYTSEQSKLKVIELAKIISEYAGSITLKIVNFTKIQEEIRKNCKEEFFTIIMRRFMMRIAEKSAITYKSSALITGESLGQVASQTIDSIYVTHEVCSIPVLQPLIGMDKQEIIEISKRINTFETSILPYEDCCTVFTPKRPKTKPKLDVTRRIEANLDVDLLVQQALDDIEIIYI